MIGLNNVLEYFIHVGTYIFGLQSETTCFVIKDGSNILLFFFTIGQFIVVLRHPPNISLKNIANDKETPQSIQSYYIELSDGWNLC